jgi:hypothetical protein
MTKADKTLAKSKAATMGHREKDQRNRTEGHEDGGRLVVFVLKELVKALEQGKGVEAYKALHALVEPES